MGIYDFVRSVGEALGLASEETPPSAAELQQELNQHNLGTEGVTVDVQGDRAIIRGSVASQDALERAVVAVGNTLGIGQVETDVEVPDAAEPVFYTVRKGDSLWKIAESQYGAGGGPKYNAIFEANTPMLKHPDKIYPGQVLRIPSA